MDRRLLLIFSLNLIFSCTDTNDPNRFLFSVPTASNADGNATGKGPPQMPAWKPYYTNFNFIVDSAGNLFFFQTQTYRWVCGTGLDENSAPEYIDLRPTEIVAIPNRGLEEFVKYNILDHEPDERMVSIGLLKDTVHSEVLYRLTGILKDTANHIKWFLRNATQEEAVVMDYKKRHATFYPDGIRWDSSKTRFPKIDITNFTPPKIEE